MGYMPDASPGKRSHPRHTSLPTTLRRGRDIEPETEIPDRGAVALDGPGAVQTARCELRRVLRARYDAGLVSIEDPDLSDQ
jgi:hypothetical protein